MLKIEHDKLVEHFNSGLSSIKIAKIYNVSPVTIQRKYKKAGLMYKDTIQIGSEFENLVVMEDCGITQYSSKADRVYKCVCVCGNIKKCRRSRLVDGRNTSCGCMMKSHLCPREKLSDLTISSHLWERIKSNAKKRNLDFSITKEYILQLFISQNQKCPLSGIELKLPIRRSDNWAANLASLDRIDSKKGYIDGNVRWLLWKVNRMKWDMTDEELYEICQIIMRNKQ